MKLSIYANKFIAYYPLITRFIPLLLVRLRSVLIKISPTYSTWGWMGYSQHMAKRRRVFSGITLQITCYPSR